MVFSRNAEISTNIVIGEIFRRRLPTSPLPVSGEGTANILARFQGIPHVDTRKCYSIKHGELV